MRRGWDVEKHLVGVTHTVTNQTVQFYYDASGTRVRRVQGSTATIYAGPHFETEQPVVGFPTIQRAYIFFGGKPIAMHTRTRRGGSAFSGETMFIHGDHPSASLRTCLGSASLMTQRMDNGSADAHPLSR